MDVTVFLRKGTEMLSAEQVKSFNEEGYLVVEDVLDQTTILDPVRAEYSALMDRLYDDWHAQGLVPPPEDKSFYDKLLISYKAGLEWFQPFDISLPATEVTPDTPFHFGPAVMNMLTAPKLLDVVQSLIGPEITSNPIQHVRIKPPANDLRGDENRAHITATSWHQDQGVTHESADNTDLVTVWIAVTDATRENGCLTVQPSRHTTELLPHCDTGQIGIPDEFIGGHPSVPLPIKSGGIVLFHPMAPHASLVNKTDGFRWSFDVRYNKTGQPTGRDHFPSFVARSAADPKTELRDADTWRGMWEDTRTRLSENPHINLYRWDLDAPYCA